MTLADRDGTLEAPTPLELGGLVVVTFGAAVAVLSLVLATVGAHEGWAALLGGGLLTAAAVVVAARRRTWSPAPWSWPAAIALGAILVLAAAQFFPGFPLAAKNRDPGVYVNHAVAIARQGDTTLTDPVAETGAELVVTDEIARIVTDAGEVAWRKLPYRSFPTDPDDPGHILPDFFHLWPSTLATAHDLGGTGALFNLTPLFAVGAVGLFFLAARRGFGLLAASVTAGLLAANELMVWQAKFPTAESLSLFVYAGALLAVALALSTRWRVAAALGGALVGVGFVARPEGIVVVGLAAVVLAGLWVFDRLDGRAWAFTAGLAPLLLLGTYQAYGRGSRYARLQQGLPSFREAVAGAVLLGLVAVAVRGVRSRVLASGSSDAGLFARLGRRLADGGPGSGLAARRLRPGGPLRRVPRRGLVPGGAAGPELPHRQAGRAVPRVRRAEPEAPGPVRDADGAGRCGGGAGRGGPGPVVGGPVGAGVARPRDRARPHLGAPHRP